MVQGWAYVEEQFWGPAAPVAPQLVNINGELKANSGVPALPETCLSTDLQPGGTGLR